MKVDLARHFPTLEPVIQRTSRFWQARTGREQAILGLIAALLALWALTSFVIIPVHAARSKAIAEIHSYETLGARLAHAGPIVTGAAAPRRGPPADIVSASAAQFGLSPSVVPDGAMMRVTIAEAPFDAVIDWIAELERSSSLRVVKMRLDRRPASGMVAAQLTVRS